MILISFALHHHNSPELSPIHAQICYRAPKPGSVQLCCRVSLSSPTPNARGLITTALTPQAVASTHPHAASLVTDLWPCDISATDSLQGDNLIKPATGGLKKKKIWAVFVGIPIRIHSISHEFTRPDPHLVWGHFSRLVQPKTCIRLWLLTWSTGTVFFWEVHRMLYPGLCSAPALHLGNRIQANKTQTNKKHCGGKPGGLWQSPCQPVQCNLKCWAHEQARLAQQNEALKA